MPVCNEQRCTAELVKIGKSNKDEKAFARKIKQEEIINMS